MDFQVQLTVYVNRIFFLLFSALFKMQSFYWCKNSFNIHCGKSFEIVDSAFFIANAHTFKERNQNLQLNTMYEKHLLIFVGIKEHFYWKSVHCIDRTHGWYSIDCCSFFHALYYRPLLYWIMCGKEMAWRFPIFLE